MLYFHSFKNPGLVVDIVQDIRNLNELSRRSRKAGMIILGGGVCKHQIANAMLIVSAYIPYYSLNILTTFFSAMGQTTQYILYVLSPTYRSLPR